MKTISLAYFALFSLAVFQAERFRFVNSEALTQSPRVFHSSENSREFRISSKSPTEDNYYRQNGDRRLVREREQPNVQVTREVTADDNRRVMTRRVQVEGGRVRLTRSASEGRLNRFDDRRISLDREDSNRRFVRSDENRVRDENRRFVRSDETRRQVREENNRRLVRNGDDRQMVRSDESRVRDENRRVVRSADDRRFVRTQDNENRRLVRDDERRMAREETRRVVRSDENRVRDENRRMVRSDGDRVRDENRRMVRSEESRRSSSLDRAVREDNRRFVRADRRSRSVDRLESRRVTLEGDNRRVSRENTRNIRDESTRRTDERRSDERRMTARDEQVRRSVRVSNEEERRESSRNEMRRSVNVNRLDDKQVREVETRRITPEDSIRVDNKVRGDNEQRNLIDRRISSILSEKTFLNMSEDESKMGWNQLTSIVFGGAALLLMYSQSGSQKKIAID